MAIYDPLTLINKPIPLSFPNVPRRLPPPPLRRCHTLAFHNSGGGKGMKWFHEIELQVRDYELDQYGVVNNSVYSNYCEYGTHKLMDKIGFDADTIIAVTEISVKYIAPLRKKDKFLLKVRIYDYSACRLYFDNLIAKLPNEELIFRGKSTVAVLHKNHRPCRISPSMISKFNHFIML
ncbi:hypothetical protein ACS0TY_030370 [Phlomoides rotata]